MPRQMFSEEDDAALRREAMRFLDIRTNSGIDAITNEDLLDFAFQGEPFRLKDINRGIRKPAVLRSALSITTTYRPPGRPRPYDDQIVPNSPYLHYKWTGVDPDDVDNRGLRSAMASGVPLIWFFGVAPGRFHQVAPVFVVDEEPEKRQFVVAIDAAARLNTADSPQEKLVRSYLAAETKVRVHQPLFRAHVMNAYGTRCAICNLAHGELLDAAHIIADSDPEGVPEVRNGLSLCKIHHAAYDKRILGISPDYVVEVRDDILDEVDGPMLEHGLKERHKAKLMVVPASKQLRPDPELLEVNFNRFRSA